MNKIMINGFSDEMQSIVKEAGIGSYLMGGVRGIGKLMSGKASLKGVKRLGGMAYRKNGLGGLAKSQVGQMAAVGAGGLGAAGLGYSALRGRRQVTR